MSAIVFVSIAESAGKSAIASALAEHLVHSGKRVLAGASLSESLDGLERVRVADSTAPRVPRGSVGVFEGSSGMAADDVRLADELDAHVVLVARLGEDVVNAAGAYGSRLAGIIWNKVPRYRKYDLQDACAVVKDAGIDCLGYVPEDRVLAASSLSDIGSHLQLDTVMDSSGGDSLIETFLIGGLVLDWGPTYFDSEPATCVVVRSGRPDVQISALQSESTRAVLMTGGGKAIDYVFYEARTKGIPLLSTTASTEEVMSRLDELPSPSSVHPEKRARMRYLLGESGALSKVIDLVASPATG